MSFSAVTRRVLLGFLSVALLFCVSRIQAQSETGTLRGTITDPSGAAVVGATVTVTPSSGQPITATSNATGAYDVRGLAPGQYQVTSNAPGFQQFQNPAVIITAGQAKTLDIPLAIQVEQQQVQVNADSQALDVNPENNADA
ncbi:MAG TPA: carboxypeptidase-like regulatory domain-containing protein, partial [Candidatus Binatia bacterium]|nr:carboxypeptidase-like regulatory domain-containing protein [Candidatus Binatia bacterium]